MRCRRRGSVLSRLLDREGVSGELEHAAGHVRACQWCKRETERLGGMRRLLGQLPRVTVSQGYEERFAELLGGSGSAAEEPGIATGTVSVRRRVAWGIAVAAAVAVIGIGGLAGRWRSPRIIAMHGEVEVMSLREGTWVPARAGERVEVGWTIRVQRGSQVDIVCRNRYEMRVSGQGQPVVIRIVSLGRGVVAYEVIEGRAAISARVHAAEGRFLVLTPTAITAVMGTRFLVEVREHGKTRVAVAEGTVEVSSRPGDVKLAGGSVIVREREQTEVWPNAAPHRPRAWRGLVFVHRVGA